MTAQNGHVDAAMVLLEHNADPNKAMSDNGATPLLMAAQNGHVDAATALLEHNADPNIANNDGGDGRWTPLFIATHQGHIVIADMLRIRA